MAVLSLLHERLIDWKGGLVYGYDFPLTKTFEMSVQRASVNSHQMRENGGNRFRGFG